ncbi:ATP-binding cassette transporter [Gregarina niphandrodes]|uniref:ATP-binding cassette transporter n=1 Tax=Gregarina niphandrodes TaxID=110365 RepID=A0A023AY04_GRENI|nr:ATP-binding cassette transporter [Gregarina niphandrodes]EZG43534.1 ATP-binding cassette transporter [Gregarina niphandrodes]|eukprot:XP_011133236.1 ATP-binding cassette transporter [Gregarina niphandrodes]
MQPQCEAEFDEMVNTLLKEGRKRALIGSIAVGASNMLRLAAFTLLFYYGATLMDREGLDGVAMIRGCMSFLLAGLQVGRSLAGNVPFSLGKNAARNVWSIVDRRPLIDEDNSVGPTPEAIEEVKFSNVAFKYPTRPNLPIYRDISFSVPRGKSVALVGASGCGKSTAVQLVERFYDVFTKEGQSFGKITINGVDIRDYYVKGLRSRIGLVSQEPSLFSGSVRDNILYGNPEASEEDIIEACRQANAWGFVQDMPEGLDTEVGRGGSRLSGGQKQRIAIARALVKKPELLILDEATSALDAASEKVVQEALNKLLATKKFNALVIAHRLSTIRDCDYIVVFVNHNTRGSQIAEVGNHQQLMAIKDGVYSKLVRIAEGAGH